MIKNTIKMGLLAAVVALSGCDSFLDINTSPNSPSGAMLSTSDIFPGTEMALCTSYCGEMRMLGGYYSQHFGNVPGSGNYEENSRFNIGTSGGNGLWYNLYIYGLNNLGVVIEKAEADNDKATKLAATVIRAATFEALVDAFGDVPFTEAADVDNYPLPHFDNGADIYAGILAELDEALKGVDPAEMVCTNFLFSDGRADGWIKTANALKLRMLMRVSNVQNVQSQLAALIAENNFPTSDVAWTGIWADQNEKCNPFFRSYGSASYSYTSNNISMNVAVVKTLEESADPRISAMMNRNDVGEYFGGLSGVKTMNGVTANTMSQPAVKFNTPAVLISLAEIEFFLAEYEVRYGSAAAAAAHYQKAIEASCDTYGVEFSSTITDAYPWDAANWKRCIGIQKWIHLAGCNNYEAWCELRRLRYPEFSTVTGEDMYDNGTVNYDSYEHGKLYTPYSVNANLGQGKILQRFPYPSNASDRNSNVPAYKGDATPLFWAE